MADLTYTPTFRHTNWVDNVDRVGAEGPNGMNVRFQAIESDLNQVSTVVAQVGSEINRITAIVTPPPSSVQTRIVFTPDLQPVPGNGTAWLSTLGVPQGFGTAGGPNSVGVMNVTPPNGVRMTAFVGHGVSSNTNGVAPTVVLTLARLPRKPTIPAANQEVIATQTIVAPGLWDFSTAVPAAQAVVDLAAFRYLLTAVMTPHGGVGDATFIHAVEILFTPA
jgi:hypothetical protein